MVRDFFITKKILHMMIYAGFFDKNKTIKKIFGKIFGQFKKLLYFCSRKRFTIIM